MLQKNNVNLCAIVKPGYVENMKTLLICLVLLAGLGLYQLSANEKVTLPRDEAAWKEKLTPEQYRVLRQEGTERPHSSPLNKEKRKGTFVCAGCGSALFASEAKYESGTGWPSFYQPIRPEAVGTKIDRSFFSVRTEVHCATCGGHLGHVFDDGPAPTGLRYCMNGVAMAFEPAAEKE